MKRKDRRNFFPTLIINILGWLFFFLIIFKLSPDRSWSLSIYNSHLTIYPIIILFFITLTFALTLTLALLLAHTRRGFFLTLFIDGFLLLRLIKQASWLNILLLAIFFFFLELWFSGRHNGQKRLSAI